jgi:putative aldouronate transport system substrate-binding protein
MKHSVFSLISMGLIFTAGFVFPSGGSQQAVREAKETLTLGIQTSSFITDYKNNYFTQYLEKLHNVNLDFYMLPSGADEAKTKVSLMVSSNDLPDAILTFEFLTDEAILDYGSKGAFIPLNKYINDPAKTPNLSAIPAEDKALMLRAMTSADGNIYGLVSFQPATWDLSPFRLYINRAWLAKLGLQAPTTTDELREVLIAFRDRDPNGNGRKDELGLYGCYNGSYGRNTILAILNAFIFYNQGQLSLDASGNRVIAPFTDPAFRKGLVYLNGLYKDGLLPASQFTDNVQQFQAALNSNPPLVGLTSAGSVGNWPNAGTNPNYLELAPMLPPLTGPDGICYTPYTEYSTVPSTFITSRAKNPDFTFKFLESFYGEDISVINRFGEEGVDWSRKPEDLAGYTNGYIEMGLYPAATLRQLIEIWIEPSNKFWHNIGPRYYSLAANNTITAGLKSEFESGDPLITLNAVHYRDYNDKHPKYLLPALKYNAEDSRNNAETITAVNEYVKQSIAEFVTGARDISSDAAWNAYLRDLDNMGLQKWIAIAQSTYNRQR